MHRSTGTVPILLLAAGSSSRMGQSKQLLAIQGKPLLQKSTEVALEASTGKVVVVLGANGEAHRNVLKDFPIEIIFNENWQSGMGSSIKAGLKYINQHHPESTAIIISVCDQPYLTSKHLNELVNLYNETQSKIVASSYKNTLGVPILFDQTNFEALRKITDDEGAKNIITTQGNQVVAVPFPLGEIDLDTMEDYNTFIQ